MLSRLAPLSVRVSRSSAGLLTRSLSHASSSHHHGEKPFDKILIANRGEIACRVIRTARRLGVKTVAVYSEADASAMHVRLADEAYCIGPAPSKDSYLKSDRILEICKKTGAQAIHPGYGFLSENARFVDLVEKEGLVFLGPPSHPMNAMGDKINSKKIVLDAGCFTIPGYQGEVENEEVAVKLAKEVGYPVMIKASAGGGGKGMRVAYNDNEVREGFRLSKAEALSSFGDDRMLIERFIENPHHIEIQVLADTHGNVVAFPERECSVQRRNQKVVEEAPSPYLLPETRKAMQMQAIQLCKAVGYRSAGTVEMLADDKQNFYFLEMNTRLQVEHPITELVSGEDLVEHMLWIGAGKPLPERLTKNPCLPFSGHAIETRVYAEDPKRKFLPSIGPLITYKEPPCYSTPDKTVRIDTGVYEGGVISMFYDPMIAKLCTHSSKSRAEAIKLQEEALDRYVVQGLSNNISFCRSVFRNKNFRDGNYCTKFIPQEYPNGFSNVELNEREKFEMIATAVALDLSRHEHQSDTNPRLKALRATEEEENNTNASSSPAPSPASLIVTLDGSHNYLVTPSFKESLQIAVTPLDTHDKPIAQSTLAFALLDIDWQGDSPLARVVFEGAKKEVTRWVQFLGRSPDAFHLRYLGAEHDLSVRTPREFQLGKHMLKAEAKDLTNLVISPMPGTLISCSVKAGQHVEAGQQLLVLEAMKMQNIIRAERSGTIKAVKKAAGNPVKVDEILIEFA